MYNIDRVLPVEWQDNAILCDFVESLPKKPYCTDSKFFCHIRTKNIALKHAYIQPHDPCRINYIVIDIDHSDALHIALEEVDLPPPHLIVQTPANSHAHLVYKLSSPVFRIGKVSIKALRYLAAVEKAMVEALVGDHGYGKNLMKNPINAAWFTYASRDAPDSGYSLAELAECLELDKHTKIKPIAAANDQGFGRNVSTFDHVRFYGYALSNNSYDSLVNELLPIAQEFNNTFDEPMLHNELMYIVRSIARYCSRNDFTASHKAFSELQRARITSRWGDNTEAKERAIKLKFDGLSVRAIAKEINVSKSTVSRWLS